MRLVDANKLKADFIGKRYGVQAIEYVIDQQPTVDAVEVVRCKDCIYYGKHTNYIKGKFCIRHSHLGDDFVFHCGEDDFCSSAERKMD